MSIIVMKMMNGDEVIAKMTSMDCDIITVDRPRIIGLTQDGNGNMRGEMMPYIITDPDRKDIPIHRLAVVTSFDASKELSDSYYSMTSGLILG